MEADNRTSRKDKTKGGNPALIAPLALHSATAAPFMLISSARRAQSGAIGTLA